MKKLLSTLAIAALVATFPASSFAKKAAAASPAPGATPAATPASEKPIPLYSEVSTIDTAGKSWTHKNKDGKEVKFVVTATTDIKQAGAPAKFEDIKVGDWVSGLRKKTGDNEYEVIKITKFGPKAPKADKPAATPAATPGATPATSGKSKKGAN
jgi:hypothetical protein